MRTAPIQTWLQKLGNLLLVMDPKMQGIPPRITNKEFSHSFPSWEHEAKKLLHLIESEKLSEIEEIEANRAFLWLNFCQEMHEAYVKDPAIFNQEPGFIALKAALEYEEVKPPVRKFIEERWNQPMGKSQMTYAECYALFCKTMGETAQYTQNFVKSVAQDLSDMVTPAIKCELSMSEFPIQWAAYLHQHAIASHYRHWWYDKGKDPERIKELIDWVKKRQ